MLILVTWTWHRQTERVWQSSGGHFWYIIFQISRDLIPAAYENEKKLVDFPRFNMYREDTSTLTHSFNPKDPHMQMS